MLLNFNLITRCILVYGFCSSQTEAMESDGERGGGLLSSQSESHGQDSADDLFEITVNNHFKTSESSLSSEGDFQPIKNIRSPKLETFADLEQFRRAFLKMKNLNEYKFTIKLGGDTYFLDKTEDIVPEFYSNSPWIMPAGLMSFISKATLVNMEEMEKPKRIRFFYNIKVESYGFMPPNSRKFKGIKITRLGD